MRIKNQEIGNMQHSKLKLAIDDALRTHEVAAVKSASIIVPESVATFDPVTRAKDLLGLYYTTEAINFELVKELALDCLDSILEHWLPDGERRGRQYVPYNTLRDDAELGSFQINTENGIWMDFATDDKGGDPISLVAYLEKGISQTAAAVKILDLIAGLKTDDVALVVKAQTKPVTAKGNFTAIMPVPEEAMKKRPVFFGSKLGSPVATWEYRNAAGEVLFCVNRFNTATGGKSFLPQIFCNDEEAGNTLWKNMAPPVPRPAYGLDRLAARPDAHVLFAEGEKSADAAQRLFPEFVAVTTMNGSQSPEKSDFTPFAGRKVLIAPDNDEAGEGYVSKLKTLLAGAGAVVVAVMRLEKLAKGDAPLAKGYDLADAEADGWTADELAVLGDNLWELVEMPPPTLETLLDYSTYFGKELYGKGLAYCDNQLLGYTDGYWPALNMDVDVKQPIMRLMQQGANASRVSSVVELIKIQYAAMPDRFERQSQLICVNNGTLNPMKGRLHSHNAKHHLTNMMDITFDPAAKCELWRQTLGEIFAPDADKAEKIQLLQEFIGYCLIPETRMHKFLWMVGGGGNGKSLILEVLNALIGKDNISHAQIERLQEKFVRAELQGKLVNISSEMSAQATVSDGYLKQIVAGDVVEAERKYQPSFSFKPYARLIGATNILPRLLDHSDGFFRRAMILRLNRQFTEAEQDKQRVAKLMLELPGILNWAIEGLQRLLARTYFELPPSSKEEVENYRVNSDPVRQFADDFLVATDDRSHWVLGSTLYDAYKSWNFDNGYKMLASNQFAERLSSIGFNKRRSSDGRYWEAKYTGFVGCGFPVTELPGISAMANKYKV